MLNIIFGYVDRRNVLQNLKIFYCISSISMKWKKIQLQLFKKLGASVVVLLVS